MKCSACGKEIHGATDGIKVFDDAWFCSSCFLGQARGLNRELRPEDLEMLRVLGREMSGILPPDIIRMMLTGFYQRSTGGTTPPPEAEMERTIGEFQRITALAYFQKVLNVLQTWNTMFSELLDSQKEEIREKVKRLTDGL